MTEEHHEGGETRDDSSDCQDEGKDVTERCPGDNFRDDVLTACSVGIRPRAKGTVHTLVSGLVDVLDVET